MTDCGPVCNLDLTSTVCTRNCSPKKSSEHHAEKKGRGQRKRNNTHYLDNCTSQTSSQHYIFMCAIMYVCWSVCVCVHLSVSPSQQLRQAWWSEESGLFIGPTGPWARPVMGHIRCILNQRKTACGLLCITHTHYTHREKPVWAKNKHCPRIH